MDFKNILASLSTIAEGETKETSKGRIHKGDYGTEYDTDKEGNEKKKAKPEVKRGRGRPKKDADSSGEVKKYDTKSLGDVFGGGKKPKKEVGKVSKKHSLKEYIEEVESNQQLDESQGVAEGDYNIRKDPTYQKYNPETHTMMYKDGKHKVVKHDQVAKAKSLGWKVRSSLKAFTKGQSGVKEAEQVTIAPAQQSTQVIKQGNKTLGTVTNPTLAATIKNAIGKGEMSLAGNEVGEQANGMGAIKSMNEAGDVMAGMTDILKVAASRQTPQNPQQFAKQVADVSYQLTQNPATQKYASYLNDLSGEAMAIASGKAQYTPQFGGMVHSVMGPAVRAYQDSQMNKPQVAEVGAELTEKAPKGWEGTVKAMKKHKDDIDNPWALAHWMKNKGYKSHKKAEEMTESFKLEDGTILTEGAMKDLVIRFMDDLEQGPKGYNISPAVELHDKGLATRIIDKTLAHGDRYKRLAGTLKSQLRDAALEEFGFTNYEESLEEADTAPDSIRAHTQHGMDAKVGDVNAFKPSRIQTPGPVVKEPTPWSTDPIAAASDRAINKGAELGRKAGSFLAGLKKPTFEGQEMKDVQLESWEKQLNSLLTEGITVSSSTGQQGSPDSVSITATDSDAQTLMGVLRNAGIGGFGAGEEKPEIGYGVTSHGEEEPSGTGTEPEASPEVVGDGDDMLALIKKMTGIDMGAPEGEEGEGQDYEDEEGGEEPEGTLEPANDGEESDEEDSGEESDDDSDDEEEQTDEGNAFTGKLAQTKQGGEFKMGDKTYKDTSSIEEDDMEEGNAFTGKLKQTPQGEKFKMGDKTYKDTSSIEEGHGTCNECGMMEDECGCDHEAVEEGFSNDAGGNAMGDTEMAKLKALLSMGNDLHKMKRSQSVGNPTQVAFESQITDWKKLSGI